MPGKEAIKFMMVFMEQRSLGMGSSWVCCTHSRSLLWGGSYCCRQHIQRRPEGLQVKNGGSTPQNILCDSNLFTSWHCLLKSCGLQWIFAEHIYICGTRVLSAITRVWTQAFLVQSVVSPFLSTVTVIVVWTVSESLLQLLLSEGRLVESRRPLQANHSVH